MNSESSLKIKTFGITDILYNGKSIFPERQFTAKIKSLLQYFIINVGKLCKPEIIAADLWPDNDYIDEKKVIQTYVYRLRNLIAKENVFKKDFSQLINITSNGGNYQMNIADSVELDCTVFLRLITEAADLRAYTELSEMVEKLKLLYSDHFMGDSPDEHIVLRLKNHYRHLYCSAMASILQKMNELGKYHEIVNICESFFVIDDLDEKINCMFLNALIETGQTHYASRHYDFITQKLRDVLDVEPSAEMLSFAKRIKAPGSEEARNEIQPASLNIQLIRNMIDEIVAEKFASQKAAYSVMVIDVTDSSAPDNATELLEVIMLKSLRRKDMYAVLNGTTAIAMLYDASQKSYGLIKERVTSCFHEIYPASDAKINIIISAALSII